MTTRLFAMTALAAVLCSCSSPNSNTQTLTHGAVQLNVEKGKTTQAEVLEKFGAPNITTIDGERREVWTYQRHATVSKSNDSYATILVLGGSSSGFEQSSRTMTLIIKFDSQKVVSDFSSMYSSF